MSNISYHRKFYISDGELEGAIKDTLGITGDLTMKLLKNLKKLDTHGREVRDISSLRFATNINTIRSSDKQIENISDLKDLKHLQVLDLPNNEIKDISVIKNLTSLQFLYLNNNKISDFTHNLDNLTNLEIADFTGQIIHNDVIYLNSNNTTVSVKNQIKIPNEVKELKVVGGSYNSFTNMITWENVTECQTLSFSYSGEIDINDKKFPVSIEVNQRVVVVVEVVDPRLRSAITSALNKSDGEEITTNDMKKLFRLNANSKNIESLSGIEHAKNLQILDCDNNKIEDISSLKGLTELENLYLDNNKIKDTSAIDKLINLRELNLDKNNICSLNLGKLNRLRYLSLSSNKISDLSKLTNLNKLRNLKTLELGDNQIEDISLIKDLNFVEELYLNNNNISDISSLENSRQILDLCLCNNEITYFPEFLKYLPLEHSSNFYDQYINNNPVTATDGKVRISNPINILGRVSGPISISHSGVYDYDTNEIYWNDVEPGTQLYFSFFGTILINYRDYEVSLTVTQPVNTYKLNNNVLYNLFDKFN